MKPSLALRRTLPMRRPLLSLLERIWNSDSKGGALVEMAVVLPVMMLLITGMIGFGIVLNNYLLLAHAADVGARYLAINQGNFTTTATNPCLMAANQIQAAAVGIPASQMSYAITLTPTVGGTASTYTSNNGTSSFGTSSNCATGGSNAMGLGGGIVTVQVGYSVTPIIFLWSHHTMNLVASTTEIIQ